MDQGVIRQRKFPSSSQRTEPSYYTSDVLSHGVAHEHRYYGLIHVICVIAVFSSLCFAIHTADTFLPKTEPKGAPLSLFSGSRAQDHLKSLVKYGPRVSGSYQSDVLAVNTLVSKIKQIKMNSKRKDLHLDFDVQTSSGSFAFVRKSNYVDLGFTSTYDNVSNVVVKVSAKREETKFILLNAHFDSVMNTEGASDDAVSCAVLLEVLRAICDNPEFPLTYGVMFLFNGAEEGGLAGSHGFVSEHKWAEYAKAVINVEAAGSGGREFVFQTGPEHPWIIDAYASSARYPFASIVAQELFQSGIIPSDTDFRVFVQYGNLIGIDLAFVSNGYVYHTRCDDAESIPTGSIQRAGDNILALTKAMANSKYLVNPAEFKQGSPVFFDVLGTFVVHYPKKLHDLLCYATSVIVFLYIIKRLVVKKPLMKDDEIVTWYSLAFAVVIILLSFIFAFTFSLATAYLMIKFNALMTWYPRPYFAFVLYGPSSLLGLLLAHYVGHNVMKKFCNPTVHSFVYANLLLSSSLLLYLNNNGILSSYLLWLWVICPFALICGVCDNVTFIPSKKELAQFLFHLLGIIPPAVIWMYHLNVINGFFMPLLGRAGTELSGEYIVASLITLAISSLLTYMMNLYHKMLHMKRALYVLLVCCFISILVGISGTFQPYSAKNPITPKRLFIQHTLRTFHHLDGTVRKQDSGIWIQPIDSVGFQSLENIPFYKNARKFECDGSYCGLPYYYAMRKIVRQSWYLEGEQPDGNQKPLNANVVKRVEIDTNVVRFYFDIKGPDHMNLYLTLKKGAILTDWSMYKTDAGHIYSTSDYMGGLTYFVFYSHGFHSSNWKFWIEIERTTGMELAEIGIARHYLHGKEARTKFLNSALHELPPWICDNAWTSNYDSFLLQ